MPTLSIHLPPKTFQKLKIAKKPDESVSAFGRSLIEQQLEQLPPKISLGSMRGLLKTSDSFSPSDSVIPAEEFETKP